MPLKDTAFETPDSEIFTLPLKHPVGVRSWRKCKFSFLLGGLLHKQHIQKQNLNIFDFDFLEKIIHYLDVYELKIKYMTHRSVRKQQWTSKGDTTNCMSLHSPKSSVHESSWFGCQDLPNNEINTL